MTRINCIPVEELTDKHLVAEYRELPRISKAAKVVSDAPTRYKMGAGHMKFFYNKGEFLRRRFEEGIVPEMQRRGFVTNYPTYRLHSDGLNHDWEPDAEAIATNMARLIERDAGGYTHA